MRIKTAYIDDEVIVRKGRYGDGGTALVLEDAETGERVAKVTVSLVAQFEEPADEHHVFVKDYAENTGMYEAMRAAGVVGESLRTIDVGRVPGGAHECRVVDLDAIAELP